MYFIARPPPRSAGPSGPAARSTNGGCRNRQPPWVAGSSVPEPRLARRRAPDVVVPEMLGTVADGPRRRENQRPRVMGILPPRVHGRAVVRSAHVGPHAGTVGPGTDGVDVVPHELVVEDPALGRSPAVPRGAVVHGGPPRRDPVGVDGGRAKYPVQRAGVRRGLLERLRDGLIHDVQRRAVRRDPLRRVLRTIPRLGYGLRRGERVAAVGRPGQHRHLVALAERAVAPRHEDLV